MFEHLEDLIESSRRRRALDKERYEKLDRNRCQVCQAEGPDKRRLLIRCFYDLHEITPEFISLYACDVAEELKDHFFMLICKNCRGLLLEAIHEWFREGVHRRFQKKDHDGYPDYWAEEGEV